MNKKLIDDINKINSNILKCNESLKNYNTMRLESNAKYLIKPTNYIELKKVLLLLRKYKIDYFIIGNGSNIIFTNKEKECIIKLNFVKSKYDCIMQASDLLMVKNNEFLKKGYSGLEYLSSIPASIGGAIYMNAGAYNHYLSDIIEFVYYMDENLNIKVLSKEKCNFTYRSSFFKDGKKIILGCKVKLTKKEKAIINKIINECREKRNKTQPLQYPNSGSIFKNKENMSAWELIEKVSLKGYVKNGAMISDKHCNFIININDAKSEDVIFLINLIKSSIKKEFEIELEEEVVIID